MTIARVKTWIAGDVLSAVDLNAEFNNIIDQPSAFSILASGGTTARTLATQFADIPNVKNFGAIGDGATNDTASFTLAAASGGVGTHLNVTVPTGTYLLNSSPTLASKTVTWQLGAGVTFSGAGVLPGTKVLIGGPAPASTGLKDWYIDTSNPDSAAPFVWWQHIPATVNMTGGAAVQGVGLSFRGDTSAQTPNAGLAETNMIRMDYTVNANAGPKVHIHLINGLLTLAADAAASGNEAAGLLFTTRSTGPTSGTDAVGVWGADLHVEKYPSVKDGKMVGLEVGMHKSPALGAARNRGIDLWSGPRSGADPATRAGDALYIQGTAGWTNFLKLIHTDDVTEVWKIDQNGNLTVVAPTGSFTALFQSNADTTNATIQAVGKAGATQVSGVIQASSGGEVVIGSTSAHPVVFETSGAEVFRIPAGTDGLLKTIAGLESTGATTATLGTASPATITTPYKWIKMRSSDNTIVYFPVWK